MGTTENRTESLRLKAHYEKNSQELVSPTNSVSRYFPSK